MRLFPHGGLSSYFKTGILKNSSEFFKSVLFSIVYSIIRFTYAELNIYFLDIDSLNC